MKHLILIVFFILGASEVRSDWYLDGNIGLHDQDIQTLHIDVQDKYTVYRVELPTTVGLELGYEYDDTTSFYIKREHFTGFDDVTTINVKVRLFGK